MKTNQYIQSIILMGIVLVLMLYASAAALEMSVSSQFPPNDIDSNSGQTDIVSSSIEITDDFGNQVQLKAAASEEGIGAISCSRFSASGDPGIRTGSSSLSWNETYTSSSSTKAYNFYLSIPLFSLGIDDNCWCSINESSDPNMAASYNMELRLNGNIIWQSSALLQGGTSGHNLSETGTDLGGTYVGSPESFHYNFGPYNINLPLGIFSQGQSFTVQFTMSGEITTPNYETGSSCLIGNPASLSQESSVSFGLGAPRISVQPSDIGFATENVGQASVPMSISLQNVGQEDLTVNTITLSDTINYSLDLNSGSSPCQDGMPVLMPGESCTAQVIFNPDSPGTHDAQIEITSNALNAPVVTIPLGGIGWASAVPWTSLYGGSGSDTASAVVQTRDGGYVVTGTSPSFSAARDDAWVLRLHPDGSTDWQKTFGSSLDDRAKAMIIDGEDNVIVAGNTYARSTGMLVAWILKLDADGNKIWEKTYGDGQDRSAQFIAAGNSGNMIIGGEHPWIMMLDSQGNIQWARIFEGVRLTALQATPTGGAVIAIHDHDSDDGIILFMELDDEGNVLWCKKVFLKNHILCEVGSIRRTTSGEYILSIASVAQDLWIAMLNQDRLVKWQQGWKIFDSPYALPYMLVTADNNLLVKRGNWLAKFNSDGTLLWQHNSPARLKSIMQTRDGGYVMAADKYPEQDSMNYDIMVSKLNSAGLVPGCDLWTNANRIPCNLNVELKEVLGITGNIMQLNVDETSWSREHETQIAPTQACFSNPPDNDSDGIPEIEEKGPDGIDSDYDGNNDGQPDWQQDSVASFHTSSGSYITLASSDGIALHDVSPVSNPAPAGMPGTVNFIYDFLSFRLEPVPQGGSTTITLYLPVDSAPDVYYKYGPTPSVLEPHWYVFDYDGQTGAEIIGNVIVLHFIDGRRGDDDLMANGVITEPGAPGYITPDGDFDHDCDVDGKDLSVTSRVTAIGLDTFAASYGTSGCD